MKKIMCKGFTLVELLVVLTIIGILSSMFTISGREASNIARANKIAEDFKIISTAMSMYYSDNTDACNLTADDAVTGVKKVTAATILEALKGYLKSTTYIVADSAAEGKFLITIHTDNTWWLSYKLPMSSLKIAQILANKALQEGFVSALEKETGKDADKYVATTTSGGNTTMNQEIVYQVR